MKQLRELFNSQKMWRSETDRRRYDFGPFNEIVDIHINQMTSYNEHLQVLLKRCSSTAHLLEQLVWSKNQNLTREQNAYVLELTKSAADDSAAIRVITVITLIYLSSTFVAVSCLIVESTNQMLIGHCRTLWLLRSSNSSMVACECREKYGFTS